MTVTPDAWLGGLLGAGAEAFRVNAAAEAPDAVREHLRGRTAFYFTKVDAADVALTKALLGVGFFVADVNVTFAAAPKAIDTKASPSVDVGPLPAGGKDDVLAIAHDSFKFTRFHLDPLITNETANVIKREWVRNYADGKRGDHLFVATMAGKPVGFLAALKSHGAAVIDLVGVGADAQRKGVGRTMIARFAQHYANTDELLVGTQVANIPSVRLYESMGFRLKSSQYVLHMHVRDGRAL